MKLYVVSDVHTEFADFQPEPGDADVVVLAGDVGVGPSSLDWIHAAFPDRPVVYVLGNHEFYRGNLDDVVAFKTAASANVHVLERDSVTIDGVRFLGTTLWTDFALFGPDARGSCMDEAASRMPDFRIVGHGDQRWTPSASIAVHQASVRWLRAQFAQAFDGPTVVVTHHAPCWQSVAERFREDSLSPAFCSRLEPLIEETQPALWAHGHTHNAFDYAVGDSRVLCNPRGYPNEAGLFGFRPDLIVTVD